MSKKWVKPAQQLFFNWGGGGRDGGDIKYIKVLRMQFYNYWLAHLKLFYFFNCFYYWFLDVIYKKLKQHSIIYVQKQLLIVWEKQIKINIILIFALWDNFSSSAIETLAVYMLNLYPTGISYLWAEPEIFFDIEGGGCTRDIYKGYLRLILDNFTNLIWEVANMWNIRIHIGTCI